MAKTSTKTPEEQAAAKAAKAAKFVELAEVRTTKALNQIATLRGLGNRNNYEFTEDQVAAILGALRAEVDTLEKAFTGNGPAKTGFKLS